MFDWVIGGLSSLFGFVGDAAGAAVGWAWDEVTTGIYTWLANGLALLIEWVWSVLDSGTTPRVTAGWFRNELAAQVGMIALAVTVAMMLASAVQAALAGRPEQIGDAVKEGVRAIVASALTLTVLDVLVGVVDEASAMVWQIGRPDLVNMLEGMVVVATTIGPLGTTFVGPLCLLFGFLGLIGLVVSLLMRSALIYVAAALAPIVWSANVLPVFRGSARKLVHLTVALVVSKLAIVITLVVAVKLVANPAGDPDADAVINDGAAAVGMLMTGFVCFLIAAITPLVLYRLMPTVEAAAIGAGVAGGWARGATTAAHTALMVKSLGTTGAASAATRGVAGQAGVQGATPRGGIAGLAGHQPDRTAPAATGGPGTSGSHTSPPTEGMPQPGRTDTTAARRGPPRPARRTTATPSGTRRRPTSGDDHDDAERGGGS
jgi:type IV secretion system protein TrbL